MGQIIDFTRYGNTEHDLALCHTNDMVDAINKTWNEHYAKTKDKQIFRLYFSNWIASNFEPFFKARIQIGFLEGGFQIRI